MKKLTCLFLCTLLLMGCAKETAPPEISLDNYLIKNAMLTKEEILEMSKSEAIISMFSASPEIDDTVKSITNAIENRPDAAVILQMDEDAIKNMQQKFDQDETLSEAESAYMMNRLLRSVPSFISARTSVTAVASTAMFTVDKSLISHSELKENTAIMLLYENGYGLYISFLPSNDGTVLLSGSCMIFPDDINPLEIDKSIHLMEQAMDITLFTTRSIDSAELDTLLKDL